MNNEWFKNIPPSGILCKCKTSKSGRNYKIDIITRYNDRLVSDYRFKTKDDYFHGYADAIPLTIEEAATLLYKDVS
jgi:hypothetical protein